MKRIIFALAQITVVVWAAFIVYKHEIKNITGIVPYAAALIFRGWLSKDINDPLFGNQSAHAWIVSQLKRLAPKRQPKSRWDI